MICFSEDTNIFSVEIYPCYEVIKLLTVGADYPAMRVACSDVHVLCGAVKTPHYYSGLLCQAGI